MHCTRNHPNSSSSKTKSDVNTGINDGPTEDSFHTNNQIDGVDASDIIESNGQFMLATCGDVPHVWNANDDIPGVSITAIFD